MAGYNSKVTTEPPREAGAEPFAQRARAGIDALLTLYDGRTGLWQRSGWWNAANALRCIVDYMTRTGDRRYAEIIATTFAKNRRGGFLNEFYDDEGWWGLTWIAAYRLTRERAYLQAAQVLFDDMCGGWDAVCRGGLWWNKQRRYKNAITNELFLALAGRLHQEAGDPRYFEWAQRAWRWFSWSGLINAGQLINDGLTENCVNNGGVTWTYNQGVILGALVTLHEIAGDDALLRRACAIADAAIATLSDANGILREPNEPDLGNDGPQFKGIFATNLYALGLAVSEPRYGDFLRSNAESIWTRNRNAQNFFGVQWAGPFDHADAARQSAAVDGLNAAC